MSDGQCPSIAIRSGLGSELGLEDWSSLHLAMLSISPTPKLSLTHKMAFIVPIRGHLSHLEHLINTVRDGRLPSRSLPTLDSDVSDGWSLKKHSFLDPSRIYTWIM